VSIDDKELNSDPAFQTVCDERRDAWIQSMETDAESEALARQRIVSSIVLRGDLSALTEDQLIRYYASLCESLGLDVRFKPFDVLMLNGKKVLYASRGCTDALARIHGITREVIDGPRFCELGTTKAIVCIVRARAPSGRQETATAVVPAAGDAINAMMKCETKAKRRATLAILGIGILDHTELETIPGLSLPADASQSSAEAPSVASNPLDVAEREVRGLVAEKGLSRDARLERYRGLCERHAKGCGMTPEELAKELTRRLK